MEDQTVRSRFGVITGLASEARCLTVHSSEERPPVLCAGARPEYAADLARQLIDVGCEALVSFGLAGGLSQALRSGDIVLADQVMGPDGSAIPTCGRWHTRVLQALGDDMVVRVGRLVSSESAITSAMEKAKLAKTTGAIAVDMESYPIAKIANQFDLPFLVVRAIADPCFRSIPQWLTATIDERGRTKILNVLAGLIRHPADVSSLPLLARDAAKGHDALRRFVFRVGPLFGFATG